MDGPGGASAGQYTVSPNSDATSAEVWQARQAAFVQAGPAGASAEAPSAAESTPARTIADNHLMWTVLPPAAGAVTRDS
jgi:hypothetical protein